jgi:hypothetical protein
VEAAAGLEVRLTWPTRRPWAEQATNWLKRSPQRVRAAGDNAWLTPRQPQPPAGEKPRWPDLDFQIDDVSRETLPLAAKMAWFLGWTTPQCDALPFVWV